MSVVARTLSVLDAFGDGRPSLRLSAIAARTGLPVPTTLRLVRELVAWGGLERQGDGSYRMGTRLWSLGTRAPCPRRLMDAAGPLMSLLHKETGHSAQLAVVADAGVLVIGERGGLIPDGTTLPWHATAAGKTLLAYADSETRRAILATAVRFTVYTVTAPGHLEAQLTRVRQGEVATAREEWRPGHVDVAVPVPGPPDVPIAALALTARTTIGGRATRLLARTAETLAEQLH